MADGSGHGRVTGLDSGIPGTCPSRLQLADSLHKGEPVQLCPPASSRADTLGNGAPLFDTDNWCDNTPNNGGVYKAFLIRTDHASVVDSGGNPTSDASSPYLSFSDRDSQTDNFKIKQQGSVCTTDCPGPPPASVSVCKFWDKNADHLEDNGEPLLPGWTIDITNQDGG